MNSCLKFQVVTLGFALLVLQVLV